MPKTSYIFQLINTKINLIFDIFEWKPNEK